MKSPSGWVPVIADLADFPQLESVALFRLDTADLASGSLNLKRKIASQEIIVTKELEIGADGERSLALALMRSEFEWLARQPPLVASITLGASEGESKDIRVYQPASIVEEDGDEREWWDLME